MKSNHTPTPWFVIENMGKLEISTFNETEEFPKQRICTISDSVIDPTKEHADEVVANAKIIVKAVEEHAALCKVSEAAQRLLDCCPPVIAGNVCLSDQLTQALSELSTLRNNLKS